MNLNEILTATRDLLKEPTAAFWSDATVVRAINRNHRFVANEITKLGQGYFLRSTTYSYVADQSEYSLPDNSVRIHRIERIDGNTPVEVKPITLAEAWAHRGQWEEDPWRSRDGYVVYGRKFKIVETPGSALTDAIRLYYVKRQPNLHSGTAGAGSTTSITFPATPTQGSLDKTTDAYEGCQVEILANTGEGQIATITAYNKTTRVASAVFGTAPDSTSTYAIIPEIPEEWHELIAYLAAIECLIIAHDDTTELTMAANKAYQLMKDQLAVPQEQASDRIIYIPD